MEKTIVHEPFYYPYTGKWYQFTDTIVNGKLLCRVCMEIVTKHILHEAVS